MYAVIRTGGKQYRVKAGDLLVVEKLDGEPGSDVSFGEVLMLGDGGKVTVGAPTVADAVVSATLIETRKGEKIKVFKKIRRQGYRRTGGHRQIESVLRVTAVGLKGKEDKWDGKVDLTTKAELNARSRNLKLTEAPAKTAAPAPKAPAKKAAPAKAEAKPKAEAPKTEAPKTEAKSAAKAAAPKKTEAKAPAKKAAPAKAKAEAKPKAAAKPAAKKAAPAKKAEAKPAAGKAAPAKKAPAKKAAPKKAK